MPIKNRVGILKEGRIILLLLIIIEFSYFTSCLTNTSWLLRAIFALPSLFIIPGAILLAILRHGINSITKLTVEGFFVSTIVSVILTSIMLMLGLPLIPFNYSLAVLILVLSLSIIALIRKIEFKPSKPDTLLVTVTFLAYVALIIYFSGLPRLFTPDETSYIFSARMGILNGAVPLMGVRPDANEIKALFQGRYFWIYLLASFIGFTGLPAYQAGLLGVSFLIMTALASSLLVENKWVSAAVFLTVILNPLLFSFSALTLNDLAISFYVVFAVSYFISSFSKVNNNLSISIKNLFCSLLGIIVLTMIKANLMVFIGMWVIIIYIILRYNLYKQNLKHKIFLITMVLPVLIYELCIDMPYVISVWMLKSRELGSMFGKFLFISPAERILGWFVAPWWNPTAPTLFTRSFADYMDYIYRILMPESSSILVSTIILVLPFFILSGNLRKKLDKNVLALLTLLSVWLFYIEAVSSFNLSDASRYSLWMIPLWIPLSLIVLRDIKDNPSFRKLLMLFMGALILLWVNIWLSRERGGVYVGYGLPSRLWTADIVMTQLILLMPILSLLFLKKDLLKLRLTIGKKLSVVKPVNLKNAALYLVIVLILLNEAYFSSQFIEKSQLYENHGFNIISDALNGLENNGSLVFANNYIYMRPYVNEKLLQQGLLLPPPDTKEEFLKLLEVAPNNTLFLISSDDATTWYEYANKYIKGYAYSDIITPEKPDVSKLPKFNLTEPILKMTFDDADETTITDHSDFGNNGVNYGTNIVEGYYGNALRFDGKQYVSIPNNDVLNVQNEITISFLAKIKEAKPLGGYMILSKGYAAMNGSFHVFIWDGNIYFSIGEYEGSKRFLSVPAYDYLGSWHHFIFTYDGKTLQMFVDGVLVASTSAKGPIRPSNFDLEVGRDSERKSYYYIGELDELQVSNRSSSTDLVSARARYYFKSYALKIKDIQLPRGKASVFNLVRVTPNSNASDMRVLSMENTVDSNLTITLSLEIESKTSKKVTVLIATDRFTHVYDCFLNIGCNKMAFTYPYNRTTLWYEPGGMYWLHLGKPRILLIDENKIIFNEFAPIWNLDFMNSTLAFLVTVVAITFILTNLEQVKNSVPQKDSLRRTEL